MVTEDRPGWVERHVAFSALTPGYDDAPFRDGDAGFRVQDRDVVTAFVHSGAPVRFLAYLEFRAGQVRGNHYHRVKVEHLCVLRGELHARYHLAGHPDDAFETTIREGGLVTVRPGCVHIYTAPDAPVTAVEFSPQPFDAADTLREPEEA